MTNPPRSPRDLRPLVDPEVERAGFGPQSVVLWLVETVFKGGPAMIDDVAFGRVREVRHECHPPDQGDPSAVRCGPPLISSMTIPDYSALIIDAK